MNRKVHSSGVKKHISRAVHAAACPDVTLVAGAAGCSELEIKLPICRIGLKGAGGSLSPALIKD